MQLRTAAIIVAAGQGSRVGGSIPKQFLPVAGRSILAHAVASLRAHPEIDAIQVVIGCGQELLYAQALETNGLPPPIEGGRTRRESVVRGIAAVEADRILVHDAARPFIPADVIDRLLAALDDADGAVPVLPLADTIVEAGDELGSVVPRERLLRVQTPQAFRSDALRRAHSTWDDAIEATDDAQMARAAGFRVVPVEGSAMLDKLTYPADFAAAERRLAPTMVSRTATGFDVHAFAAGESIMLGGVRIPHERALAGHSDADVALHALTDALLGTIGEGDIGSHFPPSDPQWRGAASHLFLAHARDLVTGRGGRIDHVDVTIICEAPKVGPHRPAIRARIAEILAIPEAGVSVKATTTERLGFTGRSEGMAAQAAATVRLPEHVA